MPYAVRPALPAAAVLCLGAAAGCLTEGEVPEDQASGVVTFHRDVEPILQEHCQSCHHDGGIAPFPLVSYDDARLRDSLIVEQTSARKMPPWGAWETEEFQAPHPWKDDPTLSEEQLATLKAWSDQGAPEGDPADAPPALTFGPQGLDAPDGTYTPTVSWTVEPGHDDFRCFVIDPGLTQDVFVTEFQVLPGEAEVVHHVLVYLDYEREAEGMDGGEGSYDCFGGSGVSAGLLGGWAPGMDPVTLPEDVGMWLPAGSLLVMQVHYHPTPDGSAVTDRTSFQLAWTTTLPRWIATVLLDGNYDRRYNNGDGLQPGPNDRTEDPEFRVPAGAVGHVESQVSTYSDLGGYDRLKVIGIASHMHYVGVDMLTQVRHAEPKEGEPEVEGLLQTPSWDFNWQRTYYYDAEMEDLPEIRPGDQLLTRCTYDNSLGNPFVAEALEEQGLSEPRDVYLGEETLDEMCLAAVVAAIEF